MTIESDTIYYCTSMLCIKGGNPMYFNVYGIIK